MSNTINIKEILRGVKPGRMQSVGAMQVIPLTSEISDDRFIEPTEAIISTTTYGTMNIENPDSDKTLILPMNAAYCVKERAQDHGMAQAALVQGKKSYSNAMCIQSSQSGTIPPKKHKMGILPFPLREIAFNKRKTNSYDKLWENIISFHRELGVTNREAHLEYFYAQFEKEMNQFVAEFELVDKQIGAIILINGAVVGIERAPSYGYWQSVWEPLIRECYGALAIKAAKNADFSVDKNRIPLDGKAVNLKQLVDESVAVRTKEEDQARNLVRGLLNDEFKHTTEDGIGEMFLVSLDHDQFSGQAVQEDKKILYASLVSKEDWVRNADWYKQEQFDI
jgi:hypothetical protein